jgi:hypothetical protein
MAGTDQRQTGRCLCGAVRFAVPPKPNWVVHCYCDSCCRAVGAPITTWAGYEFDAVSFEGAEPVEFESSPGAYRLFCGTCGSSLGLRNFGHYPGEMFLLAAAFNDPSGFKPQEHVHVQEKMPWLHMADGLPEHSGEAPVEPA